MYFRCLFIFVLPCSVQVDIYIRIAILGPLSRQESCRLFKENTIRSRPDIKSKNIQNDNLPVLDHSMVLVVSPRRRNVHSTVK